MALKVKTKNKITTIKLSKTTKSRLDKLKSYKRESYDEILEKILEILNISKVSPERARSRMISIDSQHKKLTSKNTRKRRIKPKLVQRQSLNQNPDSRPQQLPTHQHQIRKQ
jgi:hypothetical protein